MTELVLFECPKYPGGLRLTKKSCADSWKIAKTNDDRMQICKGCSIGGKNAGETVSVDFDNKHCVRCNRFLLRRVYGNMCVSCCNRGAEWLHGANAKGKIPMKHKLYVYQLLVDGIPVKFVVGDSKIVEYILRTFQNGSHKISWPPLDSNAISLVPPGVEKKGVPLQIIKKLETL